MSELLLRSAPWASSIERATDLAALRAGEISSGTMSLAGDYHMHTPLCRHASREPTELAAHALKIGLTEIGFSEHNPMPRDDWDDWHMLQANLDEYVENVQ